MKTCPNCSAIMDDDFNFCRKCGAPFQADSSHSISTISPQSVAPNLPPSIPTDLSLISLTEISKMLHKQNENIAYILDQIDNSTVVTRDSRGKHSNIRVNIFDVDIPIYSLMVLIFKWFVASIPFALIISLIYWIIITIIAGNILF